LALRSWVIVIGIASSFFLGASMGSNDVANSFGTVVGAKVLTLRSALVVASIFDVAGSLTLGVGVAKTVASKIVRVEIYEDNPGKFMVGMLSVRKRRVQGAWLPSVARAPHRAGPSLQPVVVRRCVVRVLYVLSACVVRVECVCCAC